MGFFENVIYITNIQDGFNRYDSRIRVLDSEEALRELRVEWEKDTSAGAYVDFYYFTLDQKARGNVDVVLTEAEKQYLKSIAPKIGKEGKTEIIFPLTEDLLKIAVKLNEQEMLFSTFYFEESSKGSQKKRERSTWWGNYNREYVIFIDKRSPDNEKN